MRSIIKVLTCVLLALVVFVPVRTSWRMSIRLRKRK